MGETIIRPVADVDEYITYTTGCDDVVAVWTRAELRARLVHDATRAPEDLLRNIGTLPDAVREYARQEAIIEIAHGIGQVDRRLARVDEFGTSSMLLSDGYARPYLFLGTDAVAHIHPGRPRTGLLRRQDAARYIRLRDSGQGDAASALILPNPDDEE